MYWRCCVEITKLLENEKITESDSWNRMLEGLSMFSDDFMETGREQGEFERDESFFAENWL